MSSISLVNSTSASNPLSIKKSNAFSDFNAALNAAITKAEISKPAQNPPSYLSDTTTSKNGATAVFETDQGSVNLNIDAYFNPSASSGLTKYTLPPLLLPNQKNIDALSRHISEIFPQFLAQNNIPSAPASISYDNEGKIQLPPDYPYAADFKQALANNPTVARELSTVNALTLHLVEMKKSAPFQQEYSAATTQAEINAVINKYSYLFTGHYHYDTIALQFSANGSLNITADSKSVS